MHDAILAFFRSFESACLTDNPADAAACFAESFFYSDGAAARSLPRAAISAAAAQRRDLMSQAGFGPSTLQQIDVFPLDAHYVWAATIWQADSAPPHPEARQPLVLRATYLVEIQEDGLQIVAYLSHTNFAEAVAKSRASLVS